jgi:hypothetical protein
MWPVVAAAQLVHAYLQPALHSSSITSAAELLVSYRVAGAHNVDARHNQFNGDPVTGLNHPASRTTP